MSKRGRVVSKSFQAKLDELDKAKEAIAGRLHLHRQYCDTFYEHVRNRFDVRQELAEKAVQGHTTSGKGALGILFDKGPSFNLIELHTKLQWYTEPGLRKILGKLEKHPSAIHKAVHEHKIDEEFVVCFMFDMREIPLAKRAQLNLPDVDVVVKSFGYAKIVKKLADGTEQPQISALPDPNQLMNTLKRLLGRSDELKSPGGEEDSKQVLRDLLQAKKETPSLAAAARTTTTKPEGKSEGEKAEVAAAAGLLDSGASSKAKKQKKKKKKGKKAKDDSSSTAPASQQATAVGAAGTASS